MQDNQQHIKHLRDNRSLHLRDNLRLIKHQQDNRSLQVQETRLLIKQDIHILQTIKHVEDILQVHVEDILLMHREDIHFRIPIRQEDLVLQTTEGELHILQEDLQLCNNRIHIQLLDFRQTYMTPEVEHLWVILALKDNLYFSKLLIHSYSLGLANTLHRIRVVDPKLFRPEDLQSVDIFNLKI